MAAGNTDRLMARAAARAEEDTFFVASTLATFRTLQSMDNAGLAAYLGCTEVALSRLALCRRPAEEGPMFREEVERIAQHTGCNAGSLVNILRAASVAEKMRGATPGTLLAARDRTPDEPSIDDTPPDAVDSSDTKDVESP